MNSVEHRSLSESVQLTQDKCFAEVIVLRLKSSNVLKNGTRLGSEPMMNVNLLRFPTITQLDLMQICFQCGCVIRDAFLGEDFSFLASETIADLKPIVEDSYKFCSESCREEYIESKPVESRPTIVKKPVCKVRVIRVPLVDHRHQPLYHYERRNL